MADGVSFTNLLVVAAIAVAAPILVALVPRLRLPGVVVEIMAGIVVGPSVLGWVEIDLPIEILSLIGLAFLLFLSGLEIDLRRLRGRLGGLAATGFVISIALGIVAGLVVGALGWVDGPFLVAVALSATSLGLVVPVLKDAGQIDRDLGQLIVAAASVADFGAILLLSLVFAESEGGPVSRVVLLGLFALLVVATALILGRAGRSVRLDTLLVRLQDTTAEIRVRIAVLLLVGFTALAAAAGVEIILGAFLAGAVLGLVDRETMSHPHFRRKLEAIGYGFLIPVFFVSSGLRFDLDALLADPSALARIPVFVLALLVVRGVPAVLYRSTVGRRGAVVAGLLQATSLPFIVTATQIGVAIGELSPVTAAALVAAGLVSVVVFPPVAVGLLAGADRPQPPRAASARVRSSATA
jgi:Kef-type K+ transport system membrane component KefB